MKPLLCKFGFHRWDYSPVKLVRYCRMKGCNARQLYDGKIWQAFLVVIAVAVCVMAQKDSITTLASPLTQINVLKVQVQGYDTNKVYLGACVDKYGTSTVCVAQDMLPYFQSDTTNGKLYQPQGVNLRFTMKDYDKDSTIVKAYNALMKKLTLGRVLLK
jgi:hypothetical protein